MAADHTSSVGLTLRLDMPYSPSLGRMLLVLDPRMPIASVHFDLAPVGIATCIRGMASVGGVATELALNFPLLLGVLALRGPPVACRPGTCIRSWHSRLARR